MNRIVPLASILAMSLALLTAIPAGPLPSASAEDEQDFDLKKFKKDMKDYDHDIRQEAIKRLDPNDEDQFELLLKEGFKDRDWYVRTAAQLQVAKITNESILDEAIELAGEHKDFPVREGLIAGLGSRGDAEMIPTIAEALNDENVHVRESAARALGNIKSKECIEPLISKMEDEEVEYRVFIAIREALEKLTGRYLGDNAMDWRNWWEGHKQNFEIGEEVSAEELRRAEEAGNKVKDEQKTVAGVRLDFRVKGLGAPLIVLPEFGYSGQYMQEYIEPLSNTSRIYFCDLPPLSAFEDLETAVGDYVKYPVDKLCEAFKEFVDQTKQKRVGILADQQSCWVAMRFASLYPEYLRYMILMSPYSSDKAKLKSTERVVQYGQKIKNPDIEHHAQSHILRNGNSVYTPKDQQEGIKFEQRIHFTEWWYRKFDSTIAEMVGRGLRRSQGRAVVFSDFDLVKEKEWGGPVLIIWGMQTPRFSKGDCRKINKFYPNSQLAIFEKSAMLPYIEEHEKFIKLVRRFLEKAK